MLRETVSRWRATDAGRSSSSRSRREQLPVAPSPRHSSIRRGLHGVCRDGIGSAAELPAARALEAGVDSHAGEGTSNMMAHRPGSPTRSARRHVGRIRTVVRTASTPAHLVVRKFPTTTRVMPPARPRPAATWRPGVGREDRQRDPGHQARRDRAETPEGVLRQGRQADGHKAVTIPARRAGSCRVRQAAATSGAEHPPPVRLFDSETTASR
jgi:hypothetical protein